MADIQEARIWRKNPTKKNADTLIVAMVGDSEDLGTWSRSIAHKGGNTNTVASRDMTEEEKAYYAKSYRLIFYRYKNWEELIVDEWNVTYNDNWIAELLVISRIHLTITEIKSLAAKQKNTQKQ